MIIRLNKNQFDYLHYNLFVMQKELRLKLQVEQKGNLTTVQVGEDIADEIRDWANDELQRKGFDINYELTEEGKILQGLIDAFYVE